MRSKKKLLIRLIKYFQRDVSVFLMKNLIRSWSLRMLYLFSEMLCWRWELIYWGNFIFRRVRKNFFVGLFCGEIKVWNESNLNKCSNLYKKINSTTLLFFSFFVTILSATLTLTSELTTALPLPLASSSKTLLS